MPFFFHALIFAPFFLPKMPIAASFSHFQGQIAVQQGPLLTHGMFLNIFVQISPSIVWSIRAENVSLAAEI